MTAGKRVPRFIHACSVWLLACSVVFTTQVVAESHAGELDRDMAGILAAQQLHGAVWSLVDGGTVHRVGAAGVRDARHAAPMRVDDRVHVGSVAKTVLALGVLRLVTQQRLQLDDPVSMWLPQLRFDNPWAADSPLRVRHLLDHTAGLDDARLWQVFSTEHHPDQPLARAFPASQPQLLRVRTRPGQQFSYSNMSYTLVAMVIEKVANERYETYLDRELLHPLGMSRSTFGFVTQAGDEADPALAMGHFEGGMTQPAVAYALRPAGQFTTTAADMATLATFLLGDGRLGEQVFVDPGLLRAMGIPDQTAAARAGLAPGNGLGLFTRDRHATVGQCHGGSGVGFVAMFCIFRAQGKAFFVAVNTDREGADPGALDRRLIAALALPQVEPLAPEQVDAQFESWTGWYAPEPSRFAQFAWLDRWFSLARFSGTGNTWTWAPLQSKPANLIPVGEHLLRASDRLIASHALLTGEDGVARISTGSQTFARVAPGVVVLRWLSLIAGLLGLLILLTRGLWQCRRWRTLHTRPVFVPLLSIVALALPVPWLLQQTMLSIGELTTGSFLLALVTGALPVAMLFGLWQHLRNARADTAARVDALAMLAVLQFCVLLLFWGALPLRLWG